MISIYCRDNHHGSAICADCEALLDYAAERLSRCPFGENKPTCAKCPVHCYKPEMREKIRSVMSYAGPLMIFRHPLLSLFHVIDVFKNLRDKSNLYRSRRAIMHDR